MKKATQLVVALTFLAAVLSIVLWDRDGGQRGAAPRTTPRQAADQVAEDSGPIDAARELDDEPEPAALAVLPEDEFQSR